MKKITLPGAHIIFGISLMVFFVNFSFEYMVYFDIGVNNGTRMMEIYMIRLPLFVISQIMVAVLFDKFVSNHYKRWRILLNYMAMMITFWIVFWGFALYSPGISREGGFIRFLGYYFFRLEPGRVPGSW